MVKIKVIESTSLSPGLTPLSKKLAGSSGIVSGSGAEVMSGSFDKLLYRDGFSTFGCYIKKITTKT